MKKTIFDLTSAEIKNVEKGLKATSYGKSLYLTANTIFIVTAAIFVVDFVISIVDKQELYSDALVMFSFLAVLFSVLIRWKWLQLIKVYYDEKYEKEL